MKILSNLCLHFARQDGQDRKKKQNENHETKLTKIPKTRRRKYGMNETFILKKLCPIIVDLVFNGTPCNWAFPPHYISLQDPLLNQTTHIQVFDSKPVVKVCTNVNSDCCTSKSFSEVLMSCIN